MDGRKPTFHSKGPKPPHAGRGTKKPFEGGKGGKNEDFHKLPLLAFNGAVEYVMSAEDDKRVSEVLSTVDVISVDFEWKAIEEDAMKKSSGGFSGLGHFGQSGSSNVTESEVFKGHQYNGADRNPILVAQIYTPNTCYLYLLFLFSSFPAGLASVFRSQQVLKVGCGLRFSDLRKLGLSGFHFTKGLNGLPPSFVDITDLTYGNVQHTKIGLSRLTSTVLKKAIKTTKINILTADWTTIRQNVTLRDYAILDAYATYLIFQSRDKCLANDEIVRGVHQPQQAASSSHNAFQHASSSHHFAKPAFQPPPSNGKPKRDFAPSTGPKKFKPHSKATFETDGRFGEDYEPRDGEEDYQANVPAQTSFSNPEDFGVSQLPLLEEEEEYRRKMCNSTTYTVQFGVEGRYLYMFLTLDSEGGQFHSGARLRLFTDAECQQCVTEDPFLVDVTTSGLHFVLPEFADHLMSLIKPDQIYHLKQEYNPVPHQRIMNALSKWTDGLSDLLTQVILGSTDPVPPFPNHKMDAQILTNHLDKLLGNFPRLNASQTEAVLFSLSKPFSMIIGPPGTGKTHTLAVIMSYLLTEMRLKEKGMKGMGPLPPPHPRKILICAPSNYAVDHLAKIFVDAAAPTSQEFVMVKSFAKRNITPAEPSLKQYYVNHIVNEMTQGSKDKDILGRATREVVTNAKIICCTLSMAGSALLRDMPFSTLIIDESSQCLEAECLIGIAHGVNHLVLAGDHRQLGPVVTSQGARKGGARFNLERSLFERLNEIQTDNARLLQYQYRMHPSISQWPLSQFYEGRVIDGISEMDRKLLPQSLGTILGIGEKALPSVFLHSDGPVTSNRFGSSQNLKEAEMIVRVWYALRKNHPEKSIVILTPYLGQVALIHQLSRQYGLYRDPKFSAHTISQFQGREADFVILSLVRSSVSDIPERALNLKPKRCTIGFSAEPKRINVGLTRAKYGQITLGDVSMLKTDPNWDSFLQHYSEKGCIFRPMQMSELTMGKGKAAILESLKIPSFIPLGYQDIAQYTFVPEPAGKGARGKGPKGRGDRKGGKGQPLTIEDTMVAATANTLGAMPPNHLILQRPVNSKHSMAIELLRRGLEEARKDAKLIWNYFYAHPSHWLCFLTVGGVHYRVADICDSKQESQHAVADALYNKLLAERVLQPPTPVSFSSLLKEDNPALSLPGSKTNSAVRGTPKTPSNGLGLSAASSPYVPVASSSSTPKTGFSSTKKLSAALGGLSMTPNSKTQSSPYASSSAVASSSNSFVTWKEFSDALNRIGAESPVPKYRTNDQGAIEAVIPFSVPGSSQPYYAQGTGPTRDRARDAAGAQGYSFLLSNNLLH